MGYKNEQLDHKYMISDGVDVVEDIVEMLGAELVSAGFVPGCKKYTGNYAIFLGAIWNAIEAFDKATAD